MQKSLRVAIGVCVLAGLALAQRTANIPAGTAVQVRTIEKLSSATAQPGQAFHGTLYAPVVVGGRTLFPRGADVTGRVLSAHRSGRLSDPGELELAISTIRSGRMTYAVNAEPVRIKGDSHAKSNIGKIGGGAAAGAVIGAIAGGGKGAAIGAGVGAAGGTAVAAATGKREAVLDSEAVVTWTTSGGGYARNTGGLENAEWMEREGREHDGDDDRDRHGRRDHDDDYDWGVFRERDRYDIGLCLGNQRGGLPPGLAKKDRLPPGLEKQMQRNGQLPPGLQKKVQPLPGACLARLPRLPRDRRIVVYGPRVILLDAANRMLDWFLWSSR